MTVIGVIDLFSANIIAVFIVQQNNIVIHISQRVQVLVKHS